MKKITIEEFKKIFPDIAPKMTREEFELMHRLSKPPACMHNPINVVEHADFWECKDCGLKAKKTIKGFIS